MKILILSALSMFSITSWAQALLYNDGATIKIETGAVLYVEGGIHNTSSGTIDNDGTIELKGDLLNLGTWESLNGDPNTLKFSGDQNSNVTTTGAQFYNVVIQKGTTYNVTLLDAMTVNNNLDFNGAAGTGNKLSLGANNLTLGGSATVTGFDADEFVMTGGAGSMKKAYTSLTSFLFPVGFDAATYNPATLNVTAGPNDTYSVRVGASPTDGNGFTGTPITTDVVNAVWDIQETTAGGNTVDVTLSWSDPGDELPGFNDALNAVSKNDGVNGWDALFTDLGPESPANSRTRTGITSFSAFAVGGKTVSNTLVVDAKVLLQGPFISPLMVDSLRVHDYIPLTEPYSTLPSNPYVHQAYGGGETVASLAVFNQPANADDIVDWVVVELRSAPTTIVATKTGLLQRDGNIVDLNGTSNLSIQGVADGNYYIGIRHRNHLGVRSDATLALSNTPSALIDFTVAGTAFDDPSIPRPTTPMKTLTGGALGLWAGDANFNSFVSFNGGSNDKNVILAALGGNQANILYGYNRADLNLNGATSFVGGQNDKNVILANMSPDLGTPLAAHNNN